MRGWEVKSAKENGSYEYQYHKNTGAEKLKEDCEVNHLFCSYSESYKNVIVRVMRGKDLADLFKSWEPEYIQNYATSLDGKTKQRFRRNIAYGYVKANGLIVLKIENAKLTYRDDDVIPKFNRV